MFKNDINLNLYKTFYDVARFKSFSKAAEFTYSTQPAISKAIKKLESELETELFYRKASGVELTDKGRELLFYVEKSFGNLLTAERILLETDNLNRGRLSIGMPSNLYSSFMIDKIKDFKNKYPNIEITIMTGTTSFLLNQLDLHKIDFIIDTMPIITMSNEIVVEKILELQYCFVANNKEYCNEIKSLKDLEEYSVLLPIPGTSNRDILDELLLKKDVNIKHILNIHTSEMILESVKNNLGIGYVLKDIIADDKLYELNISDKLPISEVAIVYNKKFLTTAPKKFIELYIKK